MFFGLFIFKSTFFIFFFFFFVVLCKKFFFFLSFFVVVVVFAISWAAPAACGGSQARGQIGATPAGLCHRHSNAGSELRL